VALSRHAAAPSEWGLHAGFSALPGVSGGALHDPLQPFETASRRFALGLLSKKMNKTKLDSTPDSQDDAMPRLPLIGVTACSRQIGLHPFHIAGDKYLRALAEGAGGLPLVIPALGELIDQQALLERLDGLLFTGSPSNVEPHHYQGAASEPGSHHDPARDRTTLPLIRAAVAAGVPLLGICRGFQEMNVAFGGSLHQKVHEAGPYADHREVPDEALEIQYGPRHALYIQPGGLLAGIGLPRQIEVNSLHGQGVERLAPGLRMEGLAPDGLIEAFSVEGAKTFALGVQWHPEWQFHSNPHSRALFQAFGDACRRRAERL